MFGKLFSSRGLAAAILLLAGLSVVSSTQAQDAAKRGRKYKAPAPTARVEFTVVRATNGKPVENASVIFHPMEDGKNAGNMELKTDDEGKAVIDLLNIGSDVRVQIIASGFQTYGEDYKIDKDKMAFEIQLKRPADQYSLYKKTEGKAAPTEKPEEKPKALPNSSSSPAPNAAPNSGPTAPSTSAPKAEEENKSAAAQPDVKSDAPKDDSTTPDPAPQPK